MTAPRPDALPFRSVVFDCDSTLSRIEGVDELTRRKPSSVQDQVRALTREAMDGTRALEDVYAKRLELIAPTHHELAEIATLYDADIVPGTRDLLRDLLRAGIEIHVVSGGLLPAVRPFAEGLGIAATHVHAVDVRFDEEGRYAGFDEASPLARSGGKPHLVERLTLPRRSALVGDGITDLEAAGTVDQFIVFAGVEARPAVIDSGHPVVRTPDLGALRPWLLP